MRNEVLVPKSKCPLNIIAKKGESIRNFWIFLHENAYNYLLQSEGMKPSTGDSVNRNKTTCFIWEATEEYPKAVVFCEVPEPNGWGKITSITADNIAYGNAPIDPEDVVFIKMAE